jgi:hypothetical protein
MLKQNFSKTKKVLAVLLSVFFLATLTVASASANSCDSGCYGHDYGHCYDYGYGGFYDSNYFGYNTWDGHILGHDGLHNDHR